MFLADRIIEAVSAPLELQGLELHPGASVGIAVATNSSTTADKLLRDLTSPCTGPKNGAGVSPSYSTTCSTHVRLCSLRSKPN